MSPSDATYDQTKVFREQLHCRALQFHQCEIGRCLVVKKGRTVCKNRAPWPVSDVDWIDKNGKWGMKRIVPYVNGFNPTITEAIICNNDIKLVTNGDETQDMTYYFTTYATKKRDKSTNETAILAKRYAYHQKQEAKNNNYDEVGCRLITRCATSLNRSQELSAPEVISYLMGWGDRYISHYFVPIYLDGIASVLRQAHPILQTKK
ncbi:hypothetical protein C8R41DRAFT_774608 [Lentinula lateritia]|uniref:Uncharacterized protein n=1 Tax=Lentinula lateritia TaxID=40482 RepID=A0ABQ8V583_9AGAR|nr:hypothetical protein C8R41DRAFT_774608 [Lentinula lateritia]